MLRISILTKGWEYFDIMHKDRLVARIYENGLANIYYSSFMPYNLYFEENEDIDTRLNNLNNFYYWCASRVLTLDRKYAKEILNAIGASLKMTDRERACIAISYHCLSILDVFWVKDKAEKRKFTDLSVFRHSLSNAFVDVCLRGKAITIQNSEFYVSLNQAADLGTPGVAPKAWIRENDTLYLYKAGDIRDIKAELLASIIIECFNVSSVKYEEAVYKDIMASKCRLITSEEKGIVPAEYVEIYCANKEIDLYSFTLKKDKYNYYMMIILDYLIGNIDRHWGNWGFYVNNETNRLEGLYPLMDFNKAFLAYDTIEGAVCQTINKKMSQHDAALYAIKQVGLNQTKEVDPSWFDDDNIKNMFYQRLELLKKENN